MAGAFGEGGDGVGGDRNGGEVGGPIDVADGDALAAAGQVVRLTVRQPVPISVDGSEPGCAAQLRADGSSRQARQEQASGSCGVLCVRGQCLKDPLETQPREMDKDLVEQVAVAGVALPLGRVGHVLRRARVGVATEGKPEGALDLHLAADARLAVVALEGEGEVLVRAEGVGAERERLQLNLRKARKAMEGQWAAMADQGRSVGGSSVLSLTGAASLEATAERGSTPRK